MLGELSHQSMLYTTTRLTSLRHDGKKEVGTAFFLIFEHAPGGLANVDNHFLVTNSHVLDDAAELEFLLHVGVYKDDGMRYPTDQSALAKLVPDQLGIIKHSSADLSLIPLGPAHRSWAKAGLHLYYTPMWDSEFADNGVLRKVEDCTPVFMVGYPDGHWDDVHNLPLIRKGHTASSPRVDHRGQPEGVVDMAVFPGSSGSPLIIPDPNKPGSHLLLGIMRDAYHFGAGGHVVMKDTEKPATGLGAHVLVPMHFGHYIKARELLALKPGG